MLFYEIKPYLQYEYYSNKDEWEQSRMIGYIIGLSNSTKRIKPTDIIKFNWDKETEEDNNDNIVTKEELDRLKERANEYIKLNYNNE